MKFLITLQFLIMLFMAAPAVLADSCLTAQVLAFPQINCGDMLAPPVAYQIPVNKCTFIATKFLSYTVNLLSSCVPTGYTCSVQAYKDDACRTPDSSPISPITPLVTACGATTGTGDTAVILTCTKAGALLLTKGTYPDCPCFTT